MSWLTAFNLGPAGSLLSPAMNAWLQSVVVNATVRARPCLGFSCVLVCRFLGKAP
jgi:hypothetical protein